MRLGVSVALLFQMSVAHGLAGGSYVKVSQFPSSVGFILPKTLTKEHCTAVKVARATFLTAAHCFDDYFAGGRKSEIDFYTNEFVDYDKPSIVHHVSMKIVGRPQVFPTYFMQSGFSGWFKSFYKPISVDLAVFKVDHELTDVPVTSLSPAHLHVGLPVLIGGFGPPNAEGNCNDAPCPLRMGVARVSTLNAFTASIAMTSESSPFLTGGDSGGPAYLISKNANAVSLHLIGINESDPGLHNASALKVPRFTLIAPHLSWIQKAIHDVNFGT